MNNAEVLLTILAIILLLAMAAFIHGADDNKRD